VESIANIAAKEVFTTALHEGEVEVMLLAKEIGADLVIMDDGLARKHAKYLELSVTGTVGVLLRAKQKEIISKIKPALDELIANDFYISGNIVNEILRMAGE
jgi:predicted nucleic acid-binding protein